MANRKLSNLIIQGVRSPKAVGPYVKRQCLKFVHGPSVLNGPSQKSFVHDFIDQNKFAVVILDSCRYDYFKQEVDDFLVGELTPVYTSATATVNYIQTIWDGEYDDVTYITALSAPTDHAFERYGLEYRPSEHFGEFVHVWKSCDEKELGAVPPEKITEAALGRQDKKMIIHYVQPHAPYIGDYRLREEKGESWGESLQDIYEKIGRYDRDDKVISDEELKRAYRSNLRRVLRSVRELVTGLDRDVVVTADHGEMLGEGGRYIHGGAASEQLCKLPWYTVDQSIIGTSSKNNIEYEAQSDSDITDQDVEDQLEALGYR